MDGLPPEPVIINPTPVTIECVQRVSEHRNIHPDVLYAIMLVEGGEVGKTSKPNSNGTYDISLTQINSIHLEELEKLGYTEVHLKNDGCLSLDFAAYYLNKINYGRPAPTDAASYLTAIANYHSTSPGPNKAYKEKLTNAFRMIYADE